MRTSLSLFDCIIILQAMFVCCSTATTCLTPAVADPLVGCVTCNSSTSRLALNTSSNLLVCTSTANCSTVDANDNCLQCSPGFVLDIVPGNGTACVAVNQTQEGCSSVYNGSCTGCISSSYVLVTANNISSCQLTIIDYCWKTDASGCIQCSDENIKSKSNCAINSTLCPSFDYEKWICPYCVFPNVMHESGIFCYDSTAIGDTCLVVSASGCSECIFGYYINSNNKCQLDSTYQLQFQLLPISYYYDSSAQPVRVCLDPGKSWDSTALKCSAITTSINYCMASSSTDTSQCTKCVQSYYLLSNTCYPCISAYSNCLLCDASNCLQCLPAYFLALQSNSYSIFQVQQGQATSSSTQCLPCSIYSCQYCRSEFDSAGTFNVRCDKCLFGYKLYNHTCISCPTGQYFSLSSRVCLNCAVNNSMYCNTTNQNKTDQCIGTLYYNVTSKTCVDMAFVLGNQILNNQNAYEILNKSFPYSNTLIINDAKLLMTNCYGSSNGFACLCNSTTTVLYTSLCYSVSASLMTMPINPSSFGLTNTSYSTQQLQKNSALLLLLSELPKYSLVYAPAASELISNTLFTNYLQITTNFIRNNPLQMPASVATISQQVFAQFYKTFDPYRPTVFSGPGYYFKYTPANPKADDTSVVSLSSNTVASVVYIYFNSTIDASLKRITGAAFVFLGQTSSTNLDLQLKKIGFLGSNQNYIVYSTTASGNNLQSLSVSSDVDGFVKIVSMTTSTSAAPRAYFVSASASGIQADQFATERIQNLIYRVAFIYILIFLTLYLTLIPFCALVDCVDNKSHKRKYKSASEEGTYQGIKPRSDIEQDEIALKINYKDFFPIYNIANTERPRRLLKLCLFLVNSQHSITFLSLIYFHLPGGQPLIAVLLAIPAYLCTIIVGYLCGLLTLKLPGKLKYLINLFSIGYWILWVAIMSNFIAYEYAPYVFTFAIIFFIIDMLVDFLETLLMYFTIKQESRQIKLFKALSRWLSYRGYYEFDKMAKAIDEIRDNS